MKETHELTCKICKKETAQFPTNVMAFTCTSCAHKQQQFTLRLSHLPPRKVRRAHGDLRLRRKVK